MNISFRKAKIDDAEIMAEIYNQSFYADFVRFGQCPGYGRTAEEMKKAIQNNPRYFAIADEIAVGVLSFEETQPHEYYVGCICVVPEFQGKGIGTAMFKLLLSLCSEWERIYLDTPIEKEENVMFYTRKCGMKLGNTKTDGNVKIVELFLDR